LFLIVYHGAISHHHQDSVDFGNFIPHHHSRNSGNGDCTDDHMPFPAHQHQTALASFELVQSKVSTVKSIILPVPDIIFHTVYFCPVCHTGLQQITYSYPIRWHLSPHPLIIPPNAIRGSPALA